ncbi:hypothetical protein SynMITS9220_00106 [Synechococcus sp. MIT S9220]|nr:hypothetical protein SynMITS9220_00106 [Synechococcus sp. MIT S9220]
MASKNTDRKKQVAKRLLPAYKSNLSQARTTDAASIKGLRAFPCRNQKPLPQLRSIQIALWKNCAKPSDQSANNRCSGLLIHPNRNSRIINFCVPDHRPTEMFTHAL